MTKRCDDFKRMKNDAYDTPYKCVLPLLPFLSDVTCYYEPCAGKGDLVRHIDKHGHICFLEFDIDPRHKDVVKIDAFKFNFNIQGLIITNPPWTRKILHPMIDLFRHGKGCWLLFDSDWAHTRQAIPYLKYCSKIVAVGRVKWIPDSPHVGKDNSCWYFFGPDECETVFYGMIK